MGLRTMRVDRVDGQEEERGILYDSTVGRALPFIFDSAEDADAFVEAHGDIRYLKYAEQAQLFEAWPKRRVEIEAEKRRDWEAEDRALGVTS